MSFLQQTNEEYIKQQLRSLLSDPSNKKKLQKDLKPLGLYTKRQGFTIYRDFFKTELGPRQKSVHKHRVSSFNSSEKTTRVKKKVKSELPSLSTVKASRFKGILNTEFFKKGRKVVSSGVLYLLVSKISIIPGLEMIKAKFPVKYENDLSLKFVPYYLSFFITTVSNLSKLAVGPVIPLTSEMKKMISAVYTNICSISGNRKVFMRNKDFRIQNFVNSKPWASVISESLHRFFFKKFPILNEHSFEDFLGNYIFSHNTTNQKRLCFEVFDKAGLGFLTTKHLYSFFESGLFQFIKNDLFVMVNFLCNDRYSEETEKLRRQSTRIIESEVFKLISSEPKKLNFRTFCKLPFEQKFPDLLLALAFLFLEETGSDFLTRYFSVHKFRVLPVNNGFHVVRPVNICRDFLKEVKAVSIVNKEKLKEYLPKSDNFTKELIKATVATFILGCNAEYLCEFKELTATATSMKEGAELMFGKKCDIVIENLYERMRIPNTLNINLWDFLEYFEGFFDVIFN
jgi:hypothetical protein